MPKMVVYELFEVAASSREEAIEKAKASKRRMKPVYEAAPTLGQLTHPVHLLEAQERFVTSVTNDDEVAVTDEVGIDQDYAESAE